MRRFYELFFIKNRFKKEKSMKLISKLLVTILLVLGLAAAADAATFDLTTNHKFKEDKNLYNQLKYKEDNLFLTVTAKQGENALLNKAWIYNYSELLVQGLGVKSSSLLDLPYIDSAVLQEGLLFTFNQHVSIESIRFDSVLLNDDDINLTIDGLTEDSHNYNIEHIDWSSEGEVRFNEFPNINKSPNGMSFLVTTAGEFDEFLIKSITVTPTVPVPSTVVLLGAGLVGLVGFRKQATA
jgi:hypothetical protein